MIRRFQSGWSDSSYRTSYTIIIEVLYVRCDARLWVSCWERLKATSESFSVNSNVWGYHLGDFQVPLLPTLHFLHLCCHVHMFSSFPSMNMWTPPPLDRDVSLHSRMLEQLQRPYDPFPDYQTQPFYETLLCLRQHTGCWLLLCRTQLNSGRDCWRCYVLYYLNGLWCLHKYTGKAYISLSTIFMVASPSVKNANIMLLKNLAGYYCIHCPIKQLNKELFR